MDLNDIRSLMTVVTFLVFVAIVVWTYSSRRRAAFDAAARLALHDDEPASTAGQSPATGAST